MTDQALFDDLIVSRETIERLDLYVARLKKWNRAINLVAAGTLDDAWQRHVLDSAQLIPLLPDGPLHCADLGSGAGFPGLALAIIAAELHPGLTVSLLESDRRKGAFLREIIRETAAPATLITGRVEDHEAQADIITARGFAPLPALLPMARPILRPGGRALLHKGSRYESELTAAAKHWHMDHTIHPSRIDPASVILEIGDFHERQPGDEPA
jgi:16S rRNA (guanine527-N7)-methyltransferase